MSALYSFIVLTVVGSMVNLIRYYVQERYSRFVFISGLLLAIELDTWISGSTLLPYLLMLFVGLTAYRYYIVGGVASAAIASTLLLVHTELSLEWLIGFSAAYFISGSALGWQALQMKYEAKNREYMELQQYRQSKHLNIIREVSNAFQSTLQQDQLQHTILTVMTAGYGLSFNRALLLITSEDGERLEGVRGLGALSAEEGIQNWVRIVSSNLRMADFLNLNHESKTYDNALMEMLSDIQLPIQDAGFLTTALRKGKPILYDRIDPKDPVMVMFDEKFGMSQFAVVPLISHHHPVGVIIIDKNVNFERITYDELDAVIPIADQAASALRNSQIHSKTQERAIKDALTGLYNQRYFQEMMETRFPQHHILSLLVIDIDSFKHYNDTNGHLAGNDVLSKTASIIQQSIRLSDIAFRFGGEEFVVILPDTHVEEAAKVAEQIRSNIEQAVFFNSHLQPNGKLTVSIGAAEYPKHKSELRNLLEAADHAMYTAKRSGKNKVIVYNEGGTLHELASH